MSGENETRGNTVQQRKGANMIVKLLSTVALALAVLVVFSVLSLYRVGNKTATNMAERALKEMHYFVRQNLFSAGEAELRLSEDGQLLKGDVVLSGENGLLKVYKRNTGVDVAIYINRDGKAIMAANSFDNVTPVGQEPQNPDVRNVLKTGETVFRPSIVIGGVEYLAYFEPLLADGQVMGVMVAAITVEDTKAIYSNIISTNIVFMVLLLLAFCVVTGIVIVMITKALVKVVGNLGVIAEGNLNIEVPKRLLVRSDEVGKIARAVNSVVVNFAQTITGIHRSMGEMNECTVQFGQSLDSITQSIDNVNIAVNEIAEGATQQAADTQNLGESMNSMGEAISETASRVNDLNSSAITMKKNNETVDSTLKELRDISEKTSVSVDEVQKQTNLTNESAQAIQSATDIIAGIASQTNLLSLNASIEAARVGDMGRGFAVVAEEIRGLADQSKESTDQIRSIVETLIQNSSHSVEIMDGVVDKIHQQNEKLGLTQDAFENLNEEVLRVVKAIDAISKQLDNIEKTKDGVVASLDGLAEISQNNAASTEETAATMDQLAQIVTECRNATAELNDIANELSDNAKKFKL